MLRFAALAGGAVLAGWLVSGSPILDEVRRREMARRVKEKVRRGRSQLERQSVSFEPWWDAAAGTSSAAPAAFICVQPSHRRLRLPPPSLALQPQVGGAVEQAVDAAQDIQERAQNAANVAKTATGVAAQQAKRAVAGATGRAAGRAEEEARTK